MNLGNLKDRKKLAYQVATRVWGRHPAPARLGKARRMIESLIDDDELVVGIPGMTAEAHIAVIYDEAIRRLQDGKT
jgi:hypothetical protein